MSKITNMTHVHFSPVETLAVEWQGELGEFISQRGLSQREIDAIAKNLAQYGCHVTGGDHDEPVMILELPRAPAAPAHTPSPIEDAIAANTPWGRATRVRMIGAGVYSVETSSHGGIFVSPDRLAEIPAEWRAYAAKWSKGFGESWFEEDCAWAAVALTFPAMFAANIVDMARKIGAHALPKLSVAA